MAGLCVLLVSSLLIGIVPASARHNIVDLPPTFTSDGEPLDSAVSSDVPRSADGLMGNLVLPCTVEGADPITITWYRVGQDEPIEDRFVSPNGYLVLNVTEGMEASRDGVTYYCVASNTIGPEGSEYTATLRSRDVKVFYAFFDGFVNTEIRTVVVDTIVDSSVALECDFLPGNPPPVIQWYADNTRMDENRDANEVIYDEGGRFLFILELTAAQRAQQFHCEARELLLNATIIRAPTTYTLGGEVANGEFVEYKGFGDRTVQAGSMSAGDDADPRNLITYAAAARGDDGIRDTILTGCAAPDSLDVRFATEDNVVLRVSDIEPPSFDTAVAVPYTCAVNVLDADAEGTLTIIQPVTITSPAPSASLVDRERLVGGGSVTYVCEVVGVPAPTVTWYYNGGDIPNGVSVNDNELVIADPQVGHSGIYQCMATNMIEGTQRFDDRAWILEVRMPVMPSVKDLTLTNAMAVSDRLVGTVIVAPLDTTNLEVTVEVDSDPCPEVQWSFKGTNISNGSEFTVDHPCADTTAQSPYTFTLTIANLNASTSGAYSAVFTHLDATTVLPGLYVTIPVDVELLSLDLEVQGPGNPRCFLEGSDVTLTCNTRGFPRPLIVFRKDAVVVTPGVGEFERVANISFDQIQITEVEMSDQAQYTCEAEVDGETFELTPTPGNQIFCTFPEIVDSSSTSDPKVGNELEIECQVQGIPMPEVTWTKDNKTLTTNENIFISISDSGVALVRIDQATLENNGRYRCTASNDAGSVSRQFLIEDIADDGIADFFTTSVIIGIAAGGVGLILLVVMLILLLVCVYLCARRSKSDSADFAYNVDYKPNTDYGDGRGNVDDDSVDGGGQLEAFDPDYDSVPTRRERPNQPPPYKDTPGYQHGGPLAGDDLEMVKYPPHDSESFVAGGPPYHSRPSQDNGYRPTPSADDFLSEDAQFV